MSDFVYVGFADNVVALDKATGATRWVWEIPKGQIYPAILVDGDMLFVSAMGYTYCLDAYTGTLIWENELPGLGVGVACLATSGGNTNSARAAAAATQAQQQQVHHR